MPSLSISTELDNLAFVPGDRLRGRVAWSEVGQTPSSAELRLFHYTSGKGTRDIEIVDRQSFEPPQPSAQHDFEFQLPAGPPSFSGKLITLTWALELVIIAGEEFSERLEFRLSPSGEEIDLYVHAAGNAEEFKGGKKPWFQHRRS